MAKLIHCECGYTVRGDDDEQLLEHAESHVQESHPAGRLRVSVTLAERGARTFTSMIVLMESGRFT